MIKCANICFDYEGHVILDNFSIELYENQINVIIGPSGCGKTTILNLIVGNLKAKTGRITVEIGQEKGIGYIFQKPVLLPWLSVCQNIWLPFTITDTKIEAKHNKSYLYLMKELELSKYENAMPSKLSGGMKSKVVLIRNLLYSPKLILMDEPFSSLDEISRWKNQELLKNYAQKFGTTVVFVTHSIEEALRVGDRIIILSHSPASVLFDKKVQDISKPNFKNDALRLLL